MHSKTLRSNLILLAAALIWGFTFTAQRLGMVSMGPFTFNTVRFIIGAVVLILMIALLRIPPLKPGEIKTLLRDGALLGLVLFGGSSLQQVGLVTTEAGKAGFITGLYVVIVPLMGLLWRHHTHLNAWLGALVAVAGLYLLTITDQLTLALGDGLVLGGTFFWAVHILYISYLSKIHNPLHLAFVQSLFAALYSLAIALPFESFSLAGIGEGAIPLLYTGIFSTGVAFSLQMIGQRGAHPTSAAIILSMEASFAMLGGWLLLGETLSLRGWLGCGLMLAGMILSQLGPAAKAQAVIKDI